MKTNYTNIDREWLVWEWKLDWDALDSVGANNGTLVNMVYLDSLKGYNKTYSDFNWTNAYWYIPHNSNIDFDVWTDDFTISFWFKIDSVDVTDRLVSKYWSSYLRYAYDIALLGSPNTWKIYTASWDWTTGNSIISNTIVSTNKWYHLVFRSEAGATSRLYVDWVLDTSIAQTITNTTKTPSRVNLWSYNTQYSFSAPQYLNWWLQDLRIYNKAISVNQIQNLYQEWLRKLWPTNLLFNNTDFTKYSLPNLETWKVLEISKAQYTTNTYADQSWNWNTWTAVNVTDTALWLNNTMTFNWSSSYINVANNSTINFIDTDSFSVEAWVKVDTLWAIQIFVSKQQNIINEFIYSLSISASNNFQFWIWKQNVVGNFAVSTQTAVVWKWYHLVWTTDWTNIKLYVNWVQDWGTTKTFSSATTSVATLQIWRSYDWALYFDWSMCNPKIYNRTLTADEVAQLYFSNFIWN